MDYSFAKQGVLLVLALLVGCARSQNLTIAPLQAAYQVGANATIACQFSGTVVFPIVWTLPSGNVLSTGQNLTNTTYTFSNNTRISYDQLGNFTIQNLTISDSGFYQCSSYDYANNATQQIKVYIMPDYTTETIILLAINGGLLLIFIICSVYTLIQNRKETNQKRAR